MTDWENIMRKKLEGYESNLPEGGLEAFMKTGEEIVRKRRIHPAVWVSVPVFAALAAILFFGNHSKPSGPESIDECYVADLPEPLFEMPAAADSTACRLLAYSAPATVSVCCEPVKEEPAGKACEEPAGDLVEEPVEEEAEAEVEATAVEIPDEKPLSPFIPEQKMKAGRVDLKLGPALVGTVAGGAAIALSTLLAYNQSINESILFITSPKVNSRITSPGVVSLCSSMEKENEYWKNFLPKAQHGNANILNEVEDVNISISHRMPIKTGMSLRVPLNERMSLVTGLEYSWYSSSFEYAASGTKIQKVQYLGMPVRFDYMFVNNAWLGIYLGLGASADFCTSAFLEEKNTNRTPLGRDGVTFSLLGAGGVQFNITRHTGLFVEPGLSWRAASENNVLKTWRTAHPVVFTFSTGIRITVNSKQ